MTNWTTAAADRASARGTEKIGYLSQSDLFRDLSPADIAALGASLAMTTCQRGRVFYEPGQTGQVLFILKRGRVTLYRITTEGKKLITGTVEAGSVFGEMLLLGQGMYDSFAEASEDCVLCVMSRSDVEHLIARYPKVGVRLLEHVGRRLEQAELRLAEVAYKSIPARIATTLLRLAGDDLHPVRLSQQDIADMVGTYRETSTRILNDLRTARLIDLRRMEIVVLDRDGLEAIAADLREPRPVA